MHPGESARVLETLGQPTEAIGMNADYLESLYEEFGTEMDLLVSKGALERPYGQKKLTAAEEFYEDKLTGTTSQDFMEVNRTTMNLWLLDKVLEGDQAAVTDCQPEAIKLVGEPFERLQAFTANALPTPEKYHAARVVLMIADMGKSKKVADRMQELSGQTYADHDRLLVDVLKHPIAATEMTPSFAALDQETRDRVIEMLETGFHLPQFMQGENLPAHLLPFQQLDKEWQDFSNLISIFDIGGAAGDNIQNGSITLNRNTFTSFEQAIQALGTPRVPGQSEQEHAVASYDAYLQSIGKQLGLDISHPEDRALARLARMNRAHSGSQELIAGLKDVLDNHLGDITKQTLLQFLNYTGFEPGSTWQEYSPALYNEALKSMTRAGVAKQDVLISALTNIARIDAEARAQLDISNTDKPVNIVIGDIVRAAEKNPRLLLTGAIKMHRVNEHEATASISPTPELDLRGLRTIEHLADSVPGAWQPNQTLYIGFGGGADPISSALVAKLLRDETAPVVSVWGSYQTIPHNAERLRERIYLATPETELPDMRSFEGVVAAMGLRSYLIVQDRPFRDIGPDIQFVAEHAGNIRRVAGIDTGGDVLAQLPRNAAHTSRDHMTLLGIAQASERLGVDSSLSYVLAPGIDSPQNATSILLQAKASRYNLKKDAEFIRELCDRHGLPSNDQRRYSTTLPMLLKALDNAIGLEELPIPSQEALRVARPWLPLRVIMPSMSQAVVMDHEDHRRAVGL